MKKTFIIITFLSILPFLANATHSEVRKLEHFTKIDFEGYGELVLIKGDAPSVELETNGHRRSLRQVFTEVKNETLYIDQDFDRRYDWYEFRRHDMYVTLYVTYVNLESIDLEGKINVITDNPIQVNHFDMDIEGFITGDLEFDVNELSIDSEGFVHLDIFGKTVQLDIEHEGIGRIDALDLESETCIAAVEGKATFYVNATSELIADSSGFSKIMYRGRPDKLDIDRSTFSRVRRY